MPPTTRNSLHAPRPARLPNGYVDLTSAPDSPPRRRKPDSPPPGPSSKRQKRDDATVDEVDLTDDKQPLHHVLQKQRPDAIKAQTTPDDEPTTFNTLTCVICMDMPTDLTATACALIAGENRAGPGEQKRSQCPVCRKFINRNKASDVIPLLLKKGLATQPRRKKKKKALASPAAPPPKTTIVIMNSVAADIFMVHPKEQVRDAQIQDLSDATFRGHTSTRVRAGY
ncbi:hypothetical protein ACEQ8H_002494 [Pleosporales sp. CAS-2024a]